MVKLYRKDNKYSVHQMRNSEIIEAEYEEFSGLTINNIDEAHGFELSTVDGRILRLTDDNMNIISQTASIKNSRLIGKFTWQTYLNKALLLPIGLLDETPLKIGDIVERVIPTRSDPDRLIFLGKKQVIEYNVKVIKKVKKDQFVFMSLDPDYKNKIHTYNNIKSAFFKCGHNEQMAENILKKLNTNEYPLRYHFQDRYHRTFFLDDHRKTKVIPKLVPLIFPNNIAFQNTLPVYFEHDGQFYKTEYFKLGLSTNTTIKVKKLNGIAVEKDINFIPNIQHEFHRSKNFDKKEIDLRINGTYTIYTIMYELYQNGTVVGRK